MKDRNVVCLTNPVDVTGGRVERVEVEIGLSYYTRTCMLHVVDMHPHHPPPPPTTVHYMLHIYILFL